MCFSQENMRGKRWVHLISDVHLSALIKPIGVHVVPLFICPPEEARGFIACRLIVMAELSNRSGWGRNEVVFYWFNSQSQKAKRCVCV